MKEITGDLIALASAGEFDVIVHGCNCMGSMGAGIAKGIKATFPAAFEADLATPKGERAKLGTCSVATCAVEGGTCEVVNAYTQFHYRGAGPLVEYEALGSCFAWIKQRYSGKRIGLPKIGAGLAGGDWARIAAIVEEELAGEDVTLVIFVS
ncbi:MAG: macro domain-containing protein [Planctomycetes bacterium]|nr:macro domain-containing protein [Planctomycetota bacterium]